MVHLLKAVIYCIYAASVLFLCLICVHRAKAFSVPLRVKHFKQPSTIIIHTLPSKTCRKETHKIIWYFSPHKSTFVSPWQLQAEMRDNHLSRQEGIRPTLLSAYCVGNLPCYDEQCADVFSVCISFTVWAAACRTSVLLCSNLTRKGKKMHQAHFVWLIGFLQWLRRCRQDIRQVWSSFELNRRFQYLPNHCRSSSSHEQHSAKLALVSV